MAKRAMPEQYANTTSGRRAVADLAKHGGHAGRIEQRVRERRLARKRQRAVHAAREPRARAERGHVDDERAHVVDMRRFLVVVDQRHQLDVRVIAQARAACDTRAGDRRGWGRRAADG